MKDFKSGCKVDICVGAGGVGKTTAAAILGLYHATLGERTLVITVDPAKRLADALGISRSGLKPKEVDVAELLGKPKKNGGAMFAMMPDLKKEWMNFLVASTKKAQVRRNISSNHFYQYMAEGLPGAFEIICSHVLFRLMESGQYERIILDTPPSSHVLSFFDVPKKISAVLEQSIFRTLMSERHSRLLRFTKKLVFFSGGLMEKMESLVGSHFLSEVLDFALTIDCLYEPMQMRARAMEELLRHKNTRYILVASPKNSSISDSIYLYESLKKRGFSIDQIILNQVSKKRDMKTLKDERDLMIQRGGLLSVIKLIDMYQDEIALERQMIARLDQLSYIDRRMLYESSGSNRRSLFNDLLADFVRKS